MSSELIQAPYDSLPSGQWQEYGKSGIAGSECVYCLTDEMCVTNSKSKYPVIGTLGIQNCTAVMLYDRANKIAAIGHYQEWDKEKLDALIDAFPKTARLEAHVVGANYFPGFNGATYYGPDRGVNARNKRVVLSTLEADPRISIETVDVYPKPRPRDIGIDTRTGLKIRGSRIYEDHIPPRHLHEEQSQMEGHWTHGRKLQPVSRDNPLVFDGTSQQYQMYSTAGGALLTR